MLVDPLLRIPHLYHFTCRRNLASIKEMDGLYATALLRSLGLKFFPGGNQWSLDADEIAGMDEYVHLCFTKNHPMEMLAREDGRITSPVYLEIDRRVLYEEGVRFSPGVSNKSGVSTFTIAEATEGEMIDYDVLYKYMQWGDPQVQARRQAAEKCEILVPNYVSLSFIKNLPND